MNARSVPVGVGESLCCLEHAALRVCDVFAERDGLWIATHRVVQGAIDGGDEVDLLTDGHGFHRDGGDGRNDGFRVHMVGCIGRVGRALSSGDGIVDQRIDLGFELCLSGFGEDALLDEVLTEVGQRILPSPELDFFTGPVELVVVIRRVGVVPVGLGFDECGAFTGACTLHGGGGDAVHLEDVVAVDDDALHSVSLGSVGDLAGDLFGSGDRDRVEVVLDQEHDRQLVDAGEVHRLVPVAFRG